MEAAKSVSATLVCLNNLKINYSSLGLPGEKTKCFGDGVTRLEADSLNQNTLASVISSSHPYLFQTFETRSPSITDHYP
jgi:hypothetical protein